MEIDTIVWDFGGVFIDENKGSISQSISKIFSVTELDLNPYLPHLRLLLRNGLISEDVFFSRLSGYLGCSNFNVPSTFREDIQFNNKRVRKDMFKLLSDLKAAGLTNILLSDTYLPIKKILEQKGMYSGFDYLYLSCEIGFSKYDDVINSTCFSIANIVSDHNLSTNKVIFIDDRIENCLIANRLGVRYIHLQDPVKTIALIKNFLNI